ncbi:SLBB domain-containing protein [Methylophaga sp.]|uniref:SLBB domain-containing protein n=1 Tax=Methylophaga sp. TaxID=2024840 RepID=UPI0014004D62|nr:SLBB domain-containing protein [Methylophaga sp.]MTI62592.1 polysaccharide export protein [Methylophaga sp.]
MKTLIFTFLLCMSTQLLAANPLGAGDMLRITVYDNPDLTTETRVTSDDTINFPLVGEISVAGKSVPEAEKMIARELENKGFLRNPQVNILVTEFLSQQVSILGNVTKPKRIPLHREVSLTDALALAGGITQLGSDSVSIISKRGDRANKKKLNLTEILNGKRPDVMVSPGDIIYVHGLQVSVLGAVNSPGKYPITDEATTVSDFIALAGGISSTGSDEVTLTSSQPDSEGKKYVINLNEMFTGQDADKNLAVREGDVIYVPREPKFYIYGEVNNSGAYRYEKGMTVYQALAIGGGLSSRGTENGLTLKRKNADGKFVTHEVDGTTTIKKDDVIYVKEAFF